MFHNEARDLLTQGPARSGLPGATRPVRRRAGTGPRRSVRPRLRPRRPRWPPLPGHAPLCLSGALRQGASRGRPGGGQAPGGVHAPRSRSAHHYRSRRHPGRRTPVLGPRVPITSCWCWATRPSAPSHSAPMATTSPSARWEGHYLRVCEPAPKFTPDERAVGVMVKVEYC
jgi:hypothetical protein